MQLSKDSSVCEPLTVTLLPSVIVLAINSVVPAFSKRIVPPRVAVVAASMAKLEPMTVTPLTIPVEPSMLRCAPLVTVNDTGAPDPRAGLLPLHLPVSKFTRPPGCKFAQ